MTHPLAVIENIINEHQQADFDYPYHEIFLTRLLQTTSNNLLTYLHQHFQKHNINDDLFLLLLAIEGRKEQNIQPSELSEILHTSRVKITRRLDSLEKSGWIIRTNNPHDRRSQYISLSPEGKIFLQNTLPPLQNKIQQGWQVISKEEQETLKTILTKLLNNISVGQLQEREL